MAVHISRRILVGAALGCVIARPALAAGKPWNRASAIVKHLRAPVFQNRVFDIIDYGGVGDGKTLNTDAIARAIDACHAAGGGRVVIPAGKFLTGAVRLRSRIDLHVAEGGTLLFSPDPAHYPNVLTRWEGVEVMNHSPLIYAYGEKDIAVTGPGTIDGQGSNENWWSWSSGARFGWRDGMPDQRPARNALFKMAEDGVPVEERIFGQGHYLRPPLLQTYACENVLIDGVRLRNSPFWNIHPVLCRNVIVRGVDIFGHGPNNDGCDPESVDGMLIERCVFNTGDDCIAIKSGRNADGRRLNAPSQNIVIRDCVMKDGHGGVVTGSEISGGVRWVFAENCRMDSPDLWYAIRFKNNAMRGGVLEHFHFRNISVGQVSRAVMTCDFNYEEGAKGRFTPVLRDVSIENLVAEKALRVLDSQGLPGAPVSDIRLRKCRFDGVTQASVVTHTHGLRLDGVRVNGKRVAAL